MHTATPTATQPDVATAAQLYARTIENSKRVRWDIERDVIRGRAFDTGRKFMPDGLSRADRVHGLTAAQQRLLSQVQGRSYANMFALVERYIGAKASALGGSHALGDQVAFEALVRMTDEELKHQALFRRLEAMMADAMPAGYRFAPQPNEVAQAVLGQGDWAVLALTTCIELFSLAHYRSSIDPDAALDPLWKDVFRFHWIEESQHAIIDELEWRREHERCDDAARDRGVDELIALVGAVDGIVQAQAGADADYFCAVAALPERRADIEVALRRAYRWQYIVSGATEPRFAQTLQALVSEAQMARIGQALAPIVADATAA